MSEDKKERVLSTFGGVKIQEIIEGMEKTEDVKLFSKEEFYEFATLKNECISKCHNEYDESVNDVNTLLSNFGVLTQNLSLSDHDGKESDLVELLLEEAENSKKEFIGKLDDIFGHVDKLYNEIKNNDDKINKQSIVKSKNKIENEKRDDNETVDDHMKYISIAENKYCSSEIRSKPQNKYDGMRNNNSNLPFVPKIGHYKDIYNECKSEAFEKGNNTLKLKFLKMNILPDSQGKYLHPLQYIIDTFEYPQYQLMSSLNINSSLIKNKTQSYVYVDNEMSLNDMINEISLEREIAVDLQNHCLRSFQGYSCIILISSRHKDYVIDPYTLWKILGPKLSPLFANPLIVKIIHGADKDILWLQRDFGIHLVNLFDTFQAAIVLNKMETNLSSLLQHYFNFTLEKKYMNVDWSKRPLNDDMLKLICQETHWLLALYDKMKDDLIQMNYNDVSEDVIIPLRENYPGSALGLVLERSRILCLQRYEKPLFDESDYEHIIATDIKYNLNDEQRHVFASLFKWRDNKAREMDEGHGYILTLTTMFDISLSLPNTIVELMNSTTSHTDVLEKNKEEILSMILDTRNKYKEFSSLKSTKIKHLNIEMDDIMMQNSTETDNLIKAVANSNQIYDVRKITDNNMTNLTKSYQNNEGTTTCGNSAGMNIIDKSTSSSSSSSCMDDKSKRIFNQNKDAILEINTKCSLKVKNDNTNDKMNKILNSFKLPFTIPNNSSTNTSNEIIKEKQNSTTTEQKKSDDDDNGLIKDSSLKKHKDKKRKYKTYDNSAMKNDTSLSLEEKYNLTKKSKRNKEKEKVIKSEDIKTFDFEKEIRSRKTNKK